jgi:hypothetical protein
MKIIDCIKRDNLFIDYILNHKGKENCVTRYEIAEYLTSNGFPTKPQTVHCIVNSLMFERHLPICSLNGKGYYWAKSKADIMACIDSLQQRVDSLNEHIKHLENFIIN